MLKNRGFWLGLGISLVFLILFLYRTDFSQMGRALADANYIFIVPAVGFHLLAVWLRSMRWRYLLLHLGRIKVNRLFPVVIIGYMVNNILPLRPGELVRAYLVGERENISKAATLGTIVVDRIFDGLALLFFLVTVWLFVPLPAWVANIARIGVAIFLSALAVLFVMASSDRLSQKLFQLLFRFLPQRLRIKAEEMGNLFVSGLRVVRSPGRLAGVFVISVLAWLTEAAVFYMMSFSFDLEQPFSTLLVATATANLALLVPSSPGGIGNFEYVCRQTIVLFGVEASLASAYTIALHAVLLLPIIVLGFCFLWMTNVSLAKVVHPVERKLVADCEVQRATLERDGEE